MGLLSNYYGSLPGESSELLQRASVRQQQGNVLLIKHRRLPWPQASCLVRDERSFGLGVHLEMENTLGRYDLLHCRSGELPFSEQSFLRVALVHVLETGHEAELSEACRVLAPGGELLLLGLNANGLRCRLDKAAAHLPRFGLTMIRHRLLELGMTVDARLGVGCLGINRLALPPGGVGPLLCNVADLVVVRASHNQGPPLSPLRLNEFQPGVAPSA